MGHKKKWTLGRSGVVVGVAPRELPVDPLGQGMHLANDRRVVGSGGRAGLRPGRPPSCTRGPIRRRARPASAPPRGPRTRTTRRRRSWPWRCCGPTTAPSSRRRWPASHSAAVDPSGAPRRGRRWYASRKAARDWGRGGAPSRCAALGECVGARHARLPGRAPGRHRASILGVEGVHPFGISHERSGPLGWLPR